MKPLSFLSLLLAGSLLATAQTKTEISTWVPESSIPSKLNRISHSIIITDKDSLTTEVQEYIGNALDYRKVYTYNEKKQRLSETAYTYKGEHKQTRNYSYDTTGLLREISYSYTDKTNATIHVKEALDYDGQRRVIQEIYSSDLPETRTRTFEYSTDEAGHQVTTRYKMVKNKRHLESRSTFNEQNQVMKELRKNEQGGGQSTYTHEYTYENGDWVTRKMYEQQSIRRAKLIAEYRKRRLE